MKLIARFAMAAFLMVGGSFASASNNYGVSSFQRIATFPVFENESIDVETVAEIVAATADGMKLVYTDAETESVGFVDISNPSEPAPLGSLDLPGEPTSVAIRGTLALVAVNTSEDFINTSGELIVIDVNSQTIIQTFALGGQPDAVAISPNGRYAAIAIENERDEEICVGGSESGTPVPEDGPENAGDITEEQCEAAGGEVGTLPQTIPSINNPPGFLVVVEMRGDVSDWTLDNVDLTGLAGFAPSDPEPEFVDINRRNVAVVTLQENNAIALVDLRSKEVINSFDAGAADLTQIDTLENDLIEPVDILSDVPREADGVTWINNRVFATADEGDLFGGSRGFTIYDTHGNIRFTTDNEVEHAVIRAGHYPEDRSENKGNEPENVAFGRFGRERLLFVGSERANVVLVYSLNSGVSHPKLKQILPTGVGPEGLLALPKRGLFIAASEVDDRGDKFRS